jgi:pyruvate dehydrogenase E1 component beta subunit
MKTLGFAEAIDSAIAQAMAADSRIVLFGEDVEALHQSLYVRFGRERIWNSPISEAAFLGAGVAAALGGLRPIVDLMLVDFVAVGMDALLNHAAKVEAFSGGRWRAPIVVRAACGAGYGDGGQHSQSLWGWLGHIPGLIVAVPSTPADAGGLILACLGAEGPAVFLEHKLLSEDWEDALATGGRRTTALRSPLTGVRDAAPGRWQPLPLGRAAVKREGSDLTIVSLGAGVHWALEAAETLSVERVQAAVLDLRCVVPLDRQAIRQSARETHRLLVVDEDYEAFGLSGEIAAILLEEGIQARFARVCTRGTIPYSRAREWETLPNPRRILAAARELLV